jgi:hypothetical protein
VRGTRPRPRLSERPVDLTQGAPRRPG